LSPVKNICKISDFNFSYKTDDKNPDYWKIQISLPGITNPGEINSACSNTELRIEIPGKYLLSVNLPKGLKDETAKVKQPINGPILVILYTPGKET
jgi:hypothetical protein